MRTHILYSQLQISDILCLLHVAMGNRTLMLSQEVYGTRQSLSTSDTIFGLHHAQAHWSRCRWRLFHTTPAQKASEHNLRSIFFFSPSFSLKCPTSNPSRSHLPPLLLLALCWHWEAWAVFSLKPLILPNIPPRPPAVVEQLIQDTSKLTLN